MSQNQSKLLIQCDKFNNFSTKNLLLIHSQNPDAIMVAGGKAWQKQFNQKLKPDAASINILVPALIDGVLTFKSAPVFDDSQILNGYEKKNSEYDYKALLGAIREISEYSIVLSSSFIYGKGICISEDSAEGMVKAALCGLAQDERVAFILCHHFGVDNSSNDFLSFEINEDNLNPIHTTAGNLINSIERAYQNRVGTRGHYYYFTFEEVMIINYCLDEPNRFDFLQKMISLKTSPDMSALVNGLISKIEVLSDEQFCKLFQDKFGYKLSAFSYYSLD